MPWIEPESGDVGHGVGGGNASLNNVAFSPGGVGGWQDRDNIAFANGADAWIVSTYNKVTGQIARVEFPEGVTALAAAPPVLRPFSRAMLRSLVGAPGFAEIPANVVYAGGGHVAAWLGSRGDERGLYTTTGLRLQDGGLLGMGPDGACGYKPLYQSMGPTRVREANGDDWLLTAGHAAALQMLGDRRAIWMEGFAVVVANLPQPSYVTEGGIWKAQAAFVAGKWWIAYYSGSKGIVLHPFESAARAFPILPVGDGWHAISSRGGNILRIAIAGHEGEQQGDIWGYDLDVTTGVATPLPFWPGGALRKFDFTPMGAINPPKPQDPVYPTYSFNHAVMVVPYKDPENTSGAVAEVLVNKNNQTANRPLFVAEDTLGSTWKGKLLGIYCEGDPTTAIAEAKKRKTRVLWCHDTDLPLVIPTSLRPYDIPLMELYRYKKKGETLAQAVDRWRRDFEVLLRWPGDLALDPMFYCMGGAVGAEDLTVTEVLETLAFLNEFVNRSSRVKLLFPFEYLRGNGITAHVELLRSFKDLLTAAPGSVTLMSIPEDPVDPPPPPPPPTPTTPYPAARPYQTRTT